ncbi:ribbon-helix-helix domain-containing protein [Maricaulaceae bacterium EIL42A08]|nr:ribbon-helix-helix domain-containing protein [Maricaulaceae bacterium EIL42A08]
MFVKRSVTLSGHATSVAIEPEFWAVVDRYLARNKSTLAGLIGQIDKGREPGQPLSSACRVWALKQVESGL